MLLIFLLLLSGNCLPFIRKLSANNVSIVVCSSFNFFQYVKELFYPQIAFLLSYFVWFSILNQGDGGE